MDKPVEIYIEIGTKGFPQVYICLIIVHETNDVPTTIILV